MKATTSATEPRQHSAKRAGAPQKASGRCGGVSGKSRQNVGVKILVQLSKPCLKLEIPFYFFMYTED